MERWIIKTNNSPAVIRNCSKCGAGSKFICSGNFRVNANGKNIDVWLIYKCLECDTTWNMEILSRVKPCHIEKSLYHSFLSNDISTALKYAFDYSVLRKNNAVISLDEIVYSVEKQKTKEKDRLIEIVCENDFGLRLDKLLSGQLGISRIKIKELIKNGCISSDQPDDISSKTKIKGVVRINLNMV